MAFERWWISVVVIVGVIFMRQFRMDVSAAVINDKSFPTIIQIEQLANRTKDLFYHSYDNYMEFAFPMDELKPISCVGSSDFGNLSMTLIDSLDSLLILGNQSEFISGVRWVIENVDFDQDSNVSVFETNIRIVGGLLSAALFCRDLNFETEALKLINMSEKLVQKLLPAFQTQTSIPFGSINLKRGIHPQESKDTATAAATTYLLEFGLLSMLTGNLHYWDVAKRASSNVWNHRSQLNLVGNHINIDTGMWKIPQSSVGTGIDSFYEYLFKGYLLFGDSELLRMYDDSYDAIMRYLHRGHWYVEVEIHTSQVLLGIYDSLQGFWPGLQILSNRDKYYAQQTMRSFMSVWMRYGCVPEGFNVVSNKVQIGQAQYPLRPELAESLYVLYYYETDPSMQREWLYYGSHMLDSLEKFKTSCGVASVSNVETKQLRDEMPSFFLSETLKYLYLLFNTAEQRKRLELGLSKKVDDQSIPHVTLDGFVFNTEGHPFRIQTVRELQRKLRNTA